MSGNCSCLSAAGLLSGCGASRQATQATTPPSTQPPVNSTNTIAGNWQLSAVSSVPGNPTLAQAGNIVETGNAVTTALHVDGSSCFDQMAIMALTGTVTNGMTTLTSAPLNGQVVTFTGSLTTSNFTGTYSVTGGCDSGDREALPACSFSVADADAWSGAFTSSAQKTFIVTGTFAQGTSASPEGVLDSLEPPPLIRRASPPRPSVRGRFHPGASSWALFSLLRSTRTTAPSTSSVRSTRSLRASTGPTAFQGATAIKPAQPT